MPRHDYFLRELGKALLLGGLALVTNIFIRSIAPTNYVPVGHLLIFMAAGAYGISGALTAVALGVLPATLVTGHHLEGLRMIMLASALGFSAKRFPRLPLFLVTIGFWLFVFGPAFQLLPTKILGQTTGEFVLMAFSEVLLSVIAGTLLLSPSLWCKLTIAPRNVTLSMLLVHVITAVSTIAMFGSLIMPLSSTGGSILSIALDHGNFGGLIFLGLFGILLPALLAAQLSYAISEDFSDSKGLLTRPLTRSFSGLSSEYWRRQNTESEVPLFSRTSQPTGSNLIPEDLKTQLPRHEGICALTRNGTITFMNRRFMKYAEVSHNEVIGRSIETVGMPATIVKHILDLIELTFTSGPRITELKVNQLPDRLRFFEVASMRPDSSSIAEGPDGIIITMQDITERRAVESHLLQAQRLGSLGSLVAGVAHSFNNALTTITGSASYARLLTDNKVLTDAFDSILQSAHTAGELVRQLLDFSQDQRILMVNSNLSRVVEDDITLLRRLVGEAVPIEFNFAGKVLPVVCDHNLVLQALTNVVMNAREALPDGGTISISLDDEEIDEAGTSFHVGARKGHFARLRVRDTGVGMNAEVLAKAFTPLFTTKGSKGNTGLGLSMVFAIVRAHDGFLTVESQVDKGTTISMYFPLSLQPIVEADKQDTATSDEVSGMPRPSAHREKILVVEDESAVRELVSSMLSKLGYSVSSCSDGQKALELSETTAYDLVVVDYVLPKMSGHQLISMLKAQNNSSKFLIMSGYGSHAISPDADAGLLMKPFDFATLARSVEKTLE